MLVFPTAFAPTSTTFSSMAFAAAGFLFAHAMVAGPCDAGPAGEVGGTQEHSLGEPSPALSRPQPARSALVQYLANGSRRSVHDKMDAASNIRGNTLVDLSDVPNTPVLARDRSCPPEKILQQMGFA